MHSNLLGSNPRIFTETTSGVFDSRFMETYLTTAGHNKVHATYYLSRLDPSTGNKTILLVNHKDLKGEPVTSSLAPPVEERRHQNGHSIGHVFSHPTFITHE